MVYTLQRFKEGGILCNSNPMKTVLGCLKADYCFWFLGHTSTPLHFPIKLTQLMWRKWCSALQDIFWIRPSNTFISDRSRYLENINSFLELGCWRNCSEAEIQRQSIVWQRGIWDGQGCTEKWSTQWITFKIYVDRGWTRKENMAPVQRESNNLLLLSASWGIFTSSGPARKIWITYIQAHMPYKSSGDSSNQPDGPMGSPRRPPWPTGPLLLTPSNP